MRKTINLIFTIVLSAAILSACSSGNTAQGQQSTADAVTSATVSAGSDQSNASQSSSTNDKVFTKEELSKYNGKNGNPAYIAVNGTVYDVTNVKQWRNGSHNGYQAGMDLTEAFKTASPHNSSIFKGIPVVGKYAG